MPLHTSLTMAVVDRQGAGLIGRAFFMTGASAMSASRRLCRYFGGDRHRGGAMAGATRATAASCDVRDAAMDK